MFAEKLDRGSQWEQAFMRWLQRERGYFVLPAAQFSGLADDIAPKIVSAESALIIPDLLVAHDGDLVWFEVKQKARADLHRASNTLVTGLPRRHWHDYRRLKAESGRQVWLIFVHEYEGRVVGGEIDELEDAYHHTYNGSRMNRGGTIFFKFSALRVFMSIERLREYLP